MKSSRVWQHHVCTARPHGAENTHGVPSSRPQSKVSLTCPVCRLGVYVHVFGAEFPRFDQPPVICLKEGRLVQVEGTGRLGAVFDRTECALASKISKTQSLKVCCFREFAVIHCLHITWSRSRQESGDSEVAPMVPRLALENSKRSCTNQDQGAHIRKRTGFVLSACCSCPVEARKNGGVHKCLCAAVLSPSAA
jgi:hypothetical protein